MAEDQEISKDSKEEVAEVPHMFIYSKPCTCCFPPPSFCWAFFPLFLILTCISLSSFSCVQLAPFDPSKKKKKKKVVIQEPAEEESLENAENVEKVAEKVESLSCM